jgi:hypothetical protein
MRRFWLSYPAPNPYEDSRCQETTLPLRAVVGFLSAWPGLGVVGRRSRALTCCLSWGAHPDGCPTPFLRVHQHGGDECRAAWRFSAATEQSGRALRPSSSKAWLRGGAAPVRAGLGGGAAHGTWSDPPRLGQSQRAGPINGAGRRETGPRPTVACRDAGTSAPRSAPVRLIPMRSSAAAGARALLPED